jgi:beta-lactamase regulating signal transducer with metallopeptidase domain
MASIRDIVLTFLFNAVWQGLLITGLTHYGRRLLRNVSARSQHLYWVFALLLSVVLPLATCCYVTGRIVRAELTAVEAPGFSAPVISIPGHSDLLASLLFAAYAVLAGAGVLRLIRLAATTRRLLADAQTVQLPEPVLAISERCSVRFGLPLIPVACSPDCAGPLTAGSRDPFIVLPQTLITEASEPILSTLLAHEMVHIRRHDYLLNISYEILTLPVWFLPGVRRIKGEVDRTRELACDELAAVHVTPVAYARSLVEVAGAMHTAGEPAYSLGALDGDVLEERVVRLLDRTPRRTRIWNWLAMPALGLAGLAALAFPVFINGGQGNLRGVIRDQTGGIFSESAIIVLSNLASGEERAVRTDAMGVFEFLELPAGRYDLAVLCRGFKRYRKPGITVGSASQPRLDILLRLGTVTETITVSSS